MPVSRSTNGLSYQDNLGGTGITSEVLGLLRRTTFRSTVEGTRSATENSIQQSIPTRIGEAEIDNLNVQSSELSFLSRLSEEQEEKLCEICQHPVSAAILFGNCLLNGFTDLKP
jgi:hypothetical protein